MKVHNRIQKFIFLGVLLTLVGIALFMISNRQNSSRDSSKPLAVASFYPLNEFTRSLAGERMEVTTITPSGTEPHDFEPTPQQLAALKNAQVFVYIGGNFEPWSDDAPAGSQTQKVKVTIPADATMETDGDSTHAQETEADHSEHADDAHFWLDPHMVAEYVLPAITKALQAADPQGAQYYEGKLSEYTAAMRALDTAFTTGLQTCQRRTVVTAHDAFRFMAKRYNLEVLPIAGISPEQEPDAAALAQVSRLVSEKGITTIFFETLTSPRLAETIAKQTGAQTAVLDPIEGLKADGQDEAADYQTIQRQNLQNLRTALACQ